MSEEITKDWLKIVKVIQETPDTKTLRIELKQPMDFIPGQFVMAGLNVGDPKTALVKRAYSIASSPMEKGFIDITFNFYPEGKFSPHLYALKENDLVYIEGPYGKFNLKEDTSSYHIFLAAGTGIAPLMSMIRCMDGRNSGPRKALIYSVKKPENIIYREELLEMHKKKTLDLNITITRAEGTGWNGLTGRIDSDKISEFAGVFEEAVFYICGPPEMVEGTVKILEELGIPKEKINREQW